MTLSIAKLEENESPTRNSDGIVVATFVGIRVWVRSGSFESGCVVNKLSIDSMILVLLVVAYSICVQNISW